MTTTFDITAQREGHWWLIQVPELGCATQARRRSQVESTARDLIAVWLDVPLGSFDIRLVDAAYGTA
ncbi:MAG: hypothetical protein QOI76_4366 [Frankiales bacterium]|nr:hypothetical protein [Frankiales bacterium]